MQKEFKMSRRYQLAFDALYGEGKLKPRTPRAPSNVLTEQEEQIHFIKWLRAKNLLHFAIPNETHIDNYHSRNVANAMGRTAGVPDIFVCHPATHVLPDPINVPYMHTTLFNGLFIEMKRTKGGVVSELQEAFMARLRQQGYFCAVAYGCDDAILIAETYLGWRDFA